MKCSAVVASAALAAASNAAPGADPEKLGLSRERLERIYAMLERRIAAGVRGSGGLHGVALHAVPC